MGVFCVDRTGATVFGTSARLWALTGQVLGALGADRLDTAWTLDGHVPSWLARSWGDRLFADLGEVVVVGRPVPGRWAELTPVAVYRQGTPAAATWARAGEHQSVYDTPAVPVLLRFAQVCTSAGGLVVTTLRPPAPGSARSEVAVRTLLARSGMLMARRDAGRLGTGPPAPGRRRRRTT